MQPTVRKIDFFGGLHGNYLELITNVFIDQNSFDLDQPLFNEHGACHLKNSNPDYHPTTRASHWSYNNVPFDDQDFVIRIVPEQTDMLIAVTNSFLRAGGHTIDIKNLEINTLEKINGISKLSVHDLVQEHGYRVNYPRAVIRNYFYSMFAEQQYGLDIYSKFDPATKNFHNFPFRSFFDLGKFLFELGKIAKFVNLQFTPTVKLAIVHQDFLSRNQGFHSEIKCQNILKNIFSGIPEKIDLNIIEEAWINYQISCIANYYHDDLLMVEKYPTNTLEISQKVLS